jgi:argininosuccinate synthase
MVGSPQAELTGAGQSTALIGALSAGGAEAIAERGDAIPAELPDEDLLNRTALESGTD